jgi:hypothetical protein
MSSSPLALDWSCITGPLILRFEASCTEQLLGSLVLHPEEAWTISSFAIIYNYIYNYL